MTIEERIQHFRGDLASRDVAQLVQRHLTFGECFALEPSEYFELKQVIANHFQVHHTEVLVVGSAKLGFSIVPKKRYRAFGDTSDIDVAFCSGELFDAFWKDVFDYWARGEMWPEIGAFRKYHFRGWMRPDMLPPERSFARSQGWWNFFRELTASGKFGPYRITGALYKSWHFLERYQALCVGACKALEVGG